TWDATANGGAGDWTQSDQTRYVYDGMNLVQEQAANGTVKASFVRDGNIGGVLSMTNADGTFDYHYDGNGNVVALTDSSQNIVAQYSYDAYGNLLSSSGSEADKNPFRFSSKYYDADTGLYDYGARHYDPTLGRWINRDPSGENGGLNLYGFVYNNPVGLTDAFGLDPTSPWGTGWEWLTGTGSRSHTFRGGDSFTEMLKQHKHIQDVRQEIDSRLSSCQHQNETSFSLQRNYGLGGINGVPKYLKDYSTLLTGGETGNLAVTFLGSYQLYVRVRSIDYASHTAQLDFHVTNNSTIASGLRPPVLGYTSWWKEHVGKGLNESRKSGPLSKTRQEFFWSERLNF
ncbi:MAG: RHS repeat-associated core domain-containing protein, partial [Abditibacteriaceae bacterium]